MTAACNSAEDELGETTMQLREAVDLRRGEMAALIGAGGKTTAMFHLAKELRDQGRKVLVTTTTKIFKPAKPHVDRLFLVEDIDDFANASAGIGAPATVGAGYGVNEEGKLLGLPPAWLDRLRETGTYDAILVEADGAASRLFKLPAENEPVIPSSCRLTIWLMSIKILWKSLDPEWVHRADRAVTLLGDKKPDIMTKELVLELVRHPAGCLKGIPPASRKVALINQADSEAEVDAALSLGKELLHSGADRVVISSFMRDDPVEEVLII
jgi:probable selenium-dependent hydroxylase accessory protein YqeC